MNFTIEELEKLGFRDNNLKGYFYLNINKVLYVSINEHENICFLNMSDEEDNDWRSLDMSIDSLDDLEYALTALNAN